MTPKSGLFLIVSCIAAIAAVGSVFELSYGHPRYGVLMTSIILSGSLPLAGTALWVAIQDSRANLK